MTLNSEQQQAFDMVHKYPVSIICGAPGVGKTFTEKAIVDSFKDKGKNIVLAAPTGKAAKQMTMATGFQASTIHKLLDPKPQTDPVSGKVKFSFDHNKNNPISADVLILDECSMITNSLMSSVLEAVTSKIKLIFVGDKGQLPSVGAGAVFRDMLDSGAIPKTELTEIQRNSGDIVKACHQILKGKFYEPSTKLKPEEGLNLKHVECSSTLLIQNIIKTIVCDRMPNRGFDPVWDVQVLSPTNSRTDLSCEDLNKVLQDQLNPNPAIDGTVFRIGSKVIQIKNENIKSPTGEGEYVVNGDMGRVLDIDGNNMIVRFDYPKRVCVVPLKKNHLLLAYAITTHRAQGSEFPVVVVPVHSAFGFFVDRPWLYTAISRGKQIVVTVGEFQAILAATTKNNSGNRITKLKSLLQNEN